MTRQKAAQKISGAAVVLLGALLATAMSVQAQSANVAGKYKVEFDSQMRMGPEGAQVAGRSPGMLVLEVRGDSVFGSWQAINDRNPPARKLAGKMRGDTVVVLSEPSERTMNMNGESVTMKLADEFKLTIKGDAILGTITPTQGMAGMPPVVRKVDGKREK
jgi:hypothetical protein